MEQPSGTEPPAAAPPPATPPPLAEPAAPDPSHTAEPSPAAESSPAAEALAPEAVPPPEPVAQAEPSPAEAPAPAPVRGPLGPPRKKLLEKLEEGRGRRWVAPLVVLALLGGFAFLMWLRAVGPSWVDFKDPGGLFTIQFPDVPKIATKPVSTWTGSKALVRSCGYGNDWEDEFYAVEVCTYDQPLPAAKRDPLFDSMTDAYVKTLARLDPLHDAKIRSSKPWSLAGQPGREVEVATYNGAGLFMSRLLLVDDRHMVILRTGVHDHHHGENDVRFLDSFQLVGR